MFKLKINLIITCINATQPSVEFLVASKYGSLPSEFLTPDSNLEAAVDRLFLNITTMSPRWAQLKFKSFRLQGDIMNLYYSTILSKDDELYEGFRWNPPKDTDCPTDLIGL